MRAALALWVSIFAVACGEAPPAPLLEPEFPLGDLTFGLLGDQGFETITDGTEATLISGSQGGFHLLCTVLARGLAAGTEVDVARTARRVDDGVLVSRHQFRATLKPLDGAEDTLALSREMPMFLCPTPIGVTVDGALLEVKVVFSVEAEPVAATKVELRPRCPEGAQREFCERICAR